MEIKNKKEEIRMEAIIESGREKIRNKKEEIRMEAIIESCL